MPCSRHDTVLAIRKSHGSEVSARGAPGVARSRVGKPMFHFFERSLKPTAVPESGEPPAGLVAFYWHFARQAKPLFIGLFAVGFAVALIEVMIPHVAASKPMSDEVYPIRSIVRRVIPGMST